MQGERSARRLIQGFFDFAFSGNILEIAFGLMSVPPPPSSSFLLPPPAPVLLAGGDRRGRPDGHGRPGKLGWG